MVCLIMFVYLLFTYVNDKPLSREALLESVFQSS